jgi:hydrogenase expression/formation protein HypC
MSLFHAFNLVRADGNASERSLRSGAKENPDVIFGISPSAIPFRLLGTFGMLPPAMCLAIPGQIQTIAGEDPFSRSGRVSFGGVIREVNLAYVPQAAIGDYVLVHVGFALSVVDASEAALVFEYLRQMDELTELTEGQNP